VGLVAEAGLAARPEEPDMRIYDLLPLIGATLAVLIAIVWDLRKS